jgi:hypothetical protein
MNKKQIYDPTPSELVKTFLEKTNSISTKPSPHRKGYLEFVAEKTAHQLKFKIQDVEEIPLAYQKKIIFALIRISKEENKDIK